jgi:hypothetical protein
VARRLEAFPKPENRTGRYEPFLDGGIWELVRGEDYTAETPNFVSRGREVAKLRGGRLRTRKLPGERDGVVVQFLRDDL